MEMVIMSHFCAWATASKRHRGGQCNQNAMITISITITITFIITIAINTPFTRISTTRVDKCTANIVLIEKKSSVCKQAGDGDGDGDGDGSNWFG